MEQSCIVRFDEFKRELNELERGRTLNYEEESFILKGIVKSFEVIFDLSWKSMKDIIRDYFGVVGYATGSPRENIEQAFKMGLIDDNETWISMLRDRNLLTHDYDGTLLKSKIEKIINQYYFTFKDFESSVDGFLKDNEPL